MKALRRSVFVAQFGFRKNCTTQSIDAAAEEIISGDELFERSRAARFGRQMLNLAVVVRATQPLLTLIITAALVVLGAVHPVAAQGSLLTGNAQAPVDSVKTWIDIFVWGLLAVGIGGAGWGVVNLMRGRSWGPQIIGAGAAFGFAGITSLINTTATGGAPTLPSF